MLCIMWVKVYQIRNKQQGRVPMHGFTCRGQCQGWEECRQRSFLCSLICLACLVGSSIPITFAVVCHTASSSYPREPSKGTGESLSDILERRQWFKGILVCNRLSMSFPASGPSCILQSYLFTYTPSLAPCSQASAGQDPKSNHCQAFPAWQQTWKKKHLPYMLSRLLLFWRISCELVSAPHLALHQSIFWDEIRVTMRVLEMDHNCLTSAYNTASRSPREQVFPDIRTSHPQRQRLVQLIRRGGSGFGTERAEG